MNIVIKLISSVLALLFPMQVDAQEYLENQTNTALNAFYGFCLNSRFDVKEVAGLAELLDWQSVPTDRMQMFIPDIEFGYLTYDGYLFDAPGDPPLPVVSFVGTSREPEGIVEHCAFFFDDVLVEEFVSAFPVDTNATLVSDATRIGARSTFYVVPDFPNDVVLVEQEVRNPRGLRITYIISPSEGDS